MTRKNGVVLQAEWIHPDYLEAWLVKFMGDATCLNVCSGDSKFGWKIDIDKKTNPDQVGDLFDVIDYYQPDSFDYVYCDPPFKFYTTGENRFRWQQGLFKIARKALITRRPKVNVNLPSQRHEWYVVEDERPALTLLRVDYKIALPLIRER